MATSSVDISDLPAPTDISDLPAPMDASISRKAKTSVLPQTNPINDAVGGFFRQTVAGAGSQLAGGTRTIWDLALGRGTEQAERDFQTTTSGNLGYEPKTDAERAGAAAAQSSWNPLNWPGVALSWAGKKLGSFAENEGAPAWLSTAAEIAPTATAAFAGPQLARGVAGGVRALRNLKPYTVEAEEVPPGNSQSISAAAADGGAPPEGAAEPMGAPVEGGLPKSAQGPREQTLARVGITNARESAIQGDAKTAAVDYQMTKYDQPAGRAAAAQFEAERNALAAHTENLIGDAGGTVGMDEDALANRGAMIAAPFDRLRQWFSDRTKQLYAQADQAAAAGRGTSYDPTTGATTLTNLEGVDRALADPTFQNTLAARNQQGLLGAVRNQLDFFRQNNPHGFTASTAEQFRQWLNSVWTNDNKYAIGQLKDAVDDDVTKAAGGDVYAQARAIRTLRRTTLDDPNGISQLFDVDPNTPINRTTALEKIPDKLTQLPIDQYANVLKTLREMPEELQPDAQAAIAEIKGHLLNKALQAGTQTSRGVGAQVWGTDRVANVLRTNAAKFRIAFGDDSVAQRGIEDLSNAGQILRVEQGYPGADAQAANAMKRGLISRTLGHLGGAGGAAAGGWMGGPLGAAVGGAAGESAGLSVGQRAAERSALKAWQKRTRPTAP